MRPHRFYKFFKYMLAAAGADLFLFAPVPAAAQDAILCTLSIQPKTESDGREIILTASFHEIPETGIAAGILKISYNASCLTFQSAELAGQGRSSDLTANAAGGYIYLLFLDSTGGENPISEDGVLYRITFTVKEDASPGTLEFSAEAEGFADPSAVEIPVTVQGCSGTVGADHVHTSSPLPSKADGSTAEETMVRIWAVICAAALVLTAAAVYWSIVYMKKKKKKTAAGPEFRQPQQDLQSDDQQ